MMIQFALKSMLPVLMVFASVVLVIQAQSSDDSELRSLFLPQDCAPPCFLTIQPGVTTVDQAMDILKHQDWVGEIQPHYIAQVTSTHHVRGWLFWDWNARAPAWLQSSASESGHAGALSTFDGVVDAIILSTRIPFGRVRTLLGAPVSSLLSLHDRVLRRGVFTSNSLHYQQFYPQSNLEIEAVAPCQRLSDLWFTPTSITVFSEARQGTMIPIFFDDRPLLSQTIYPRDLLCHS